MPARGRVPPTPAAVAVTPALPRLVGARYVVPLREGGSLPAVVDTESGGTFVVKFRGAGQGPKALIAEALVASVGVALGLPIPTPAVVDLEDGFGRGEPDPDFAAVERHLATFQAITAGLPAAGPLAA